MDEHKGHNLEDISSMGRGKVTKEMQQQVVTPEKLNYYKARVTAEMTVLRVLMRELKRDGLLWASDQVCDIIRGLEELQIEAEEPTDQDLEKINWTPGKLLDVGSVITLADGKEYTVVNTNEDNYGIKRITTKGNDSGV